MNSWPWLLSLAFVAVVGWGASAFVLPALGLRAALRRMVSGDRDAPAFLRHRGWLGGAVDDLSILGERLHDAQRQLGDRAFDLQAILGSLTEGVVIVDAAQRIRLANDSLHRMFDLSIPPLGRTLLEIFRDHELQAAVTGAVVNR